MSRARASANDPADPLNSSARPGSGPAVASSRTAESRTLWVTAWPALSPPRPSGWSLPSGTRDREGFSPNNPQFEAGIRIDPPLSVAWAAGTTPIATATAEPPLEPPALRVGSKGLGVTPNSRRCRAHVQAELRRVGLPEEDQPGGPQAPDQHGVVLGHEVRRGPDCRWWPACPGPRC